VTVYDSNDSDALMNAMQANLAGAAEVFGRLSQGSSHLVQIIDSETLKGAAYSAGRTMFVTYIDPMVQKLNEAISDIRNDLSTYRAADGEIRSIDNHIDGNLVQQQLEHTNRMISVLQQKIKDARETLQWITAPANGSGLDTGPMRSREGLNASIDSMNNQLRTLEELKADYDEELAALRAFESQTAPLFKDSARVFKDAMRGVNAINSTRAAADGSITFPPGTDMSWLSALRKHTLSTPSNKRDPNEVPAAYRARIRDIQDNPILTANEKAEQIGEVYERWLYSLAPEAFDEYAKARRNYDKRREDYESKHGKNKYPPTDQDAKLIKADEKLAKTLHGTHVNIRSVAQRFGDDVAKISGYTNLPEFYDMVQTEHPLDLKGRKLNNQHTYSIWSRSWDGNPKNEYGAPQKDFVGNYLYGYYGRSVHIAPGILKSAAGIQQMQHDGKFHDKDIMDDKDNILKNWGDNPGDQDAIQKGIDAHDQQRP
jgi:hypothetical protein